MQDAIKAMVQQAFHLASGMNSISPELNDPRASIDLIPNGKPQLSAQSSLQYTDDTQSINSFFPDQQSLTKQRVRFYFILKYKLNICQLLLRVLILSCKWPLRTLVDL
jgi:hypothetical protein